MIATALPTSESFRIRGARPTAGGVTGEAQRRVLLLQ